MFDSNKIKQLDNYQLYQLIQNEALDKTTLSELRTEFNSRGISENEILRLKQKYELNHSKFNEEIEANTWNPIFTAFALKRHFKHVALLQTQRRKKEAVIYLWKLCLGIALHMVVVTILIIIFKAK